MTPIDPDALAAEIRDRITGQVAASVARRDRRRQVRADLAERRDAGLRQRHAAKLARKIMPTHKSANNSPTPTPPPASVPAPRALGAPVRPVGEGNRGVPGPDEQVRLRTTLGAVLRRERAARRLSQSALAALAGCHPRTVERLEAGQRRPSSAMIDALAVALGVPPGYAAAGRREQVEALRAELVAAAGPSLVESTPGGARRRRRRLRRARLAASQIAVPVMRAQRGLRPVWQSAREVPADVAAAVRRYAR